MSSASSPPPWTLAGLEERSLQRAHWVWVWGGVSTGCTPHFTSSLLPGWGSTHCSDFEAALSIPFGDGLRYLSGPAPPRPAEEPAYAQERLSPPRPAGEPAYAQERPSPPHPAEEPVYTQERPSPRSLLGGCLVPSSTVALGSRGTAGGSQSSEPVSAGAASLKAPIAVSPSRCGFHVARPSLQRLIQRRDWCSRRAHDLAPQ